MKVAIVVPLASHIHSEAFDSIFEAMLGVYEYLDWDDKNVIRKFGHRGQTAIARTALGKEAIDEGAEWLFWMDDDQIVPRRAFQRLMETGKKMVSALYFIRSAAGPDGSGPYPVCGFNYDPTGKVAFVEPPIDPPALHEVGIVGFGCLLMHRSVWEDVWKMTNGLPFKTEPSLTEDVWFEHHARKAGHSIWLDTRIRVGHLKTIMITADNKDRIGGMK